MGKNTGVSWAHHTFNIVWGCDEDSTECAFCYARDLARQWGWSESGKSGPEIWGAEAPRRTFSEKYWNQLLVWNAAAVAAGERRRVFVSSMADWAEDHPTTEAELLKLWPYIRRCASLDFLMLTKRAHNIASRLPADWSTWTNGYPNVWLGTTVGTASPTALSKLTGKPVLDRVRELAAVKAVVRWISYEPAVGPLAQALEPWLVAGLDWVIFGGESGPHHRPQNDSWPREMRDACRHHQVAFWHKQTANRFPGRGEELDGRLWHQLPTPRSSLEIPAVN